MTVDLRETECEKRALWIEIRLNPGIVALNNNMCIWWCLPFLLFHATLNLVCMKKQRNFKSRSLDLPTSLYNLANFPRRKINWI